MCFCGFLPAPCCWECPVERCLRCRLCPTTAPVLKEGQPHAGGRGLIPCRCQQFSCTWALKKGNLVASQSWCCPGSAPLCAVGPADAAGWQTRRGSADEQSCSRWRVNRSCCHCPSSFPAPAGWHSSAAVSVGASSCLFVNGCFARGAQQLVPGAVWQVLGAVAGRTRN